MFPFYSPAAAGSRSSAPWLHRGGALLASAVVHAAAAATIGGALGAATRLSLHGPERPAVEVEIDVPAPLGAPLASAGAAAREPARARRPARPTQALRRTVSAPSVTSVEATPVATAAETAAPRFALSAGTVASGPALAGPADLSRGASAIGDADAPLGERYVDVPARLLRATPPPYPSAAQQAQIEADVPVEIVVDAAGHVVAARPLGKAGFGLDDAAVRAVRGYLFSPAVRAGRPVSVRMRWTLQFRLR